MFNQIVTKYLLTEITLEEFFGSMDILHVGNHIMYLVEILKREAGLSTKYFIIIEKCRGFVPSHNQGTCKASLQYESSCALVDKIVVVPVR